VCGSKRRRAHDVHTGAWIPQGKIIGRILICKSGDPGDFKSIVWAHPAIFDLI
jgi:hypothetical protein